MSSLEKAVMVRRLARAALATSRLAEETIQDAEKSFELST